MSYCTMTDYMQLYMQYCAHFNFLLFAASKIITQQEEVKGKQILGFWHTSAHWNSTYVTNMIMNSPFLLRNWLTSQQHIFVISGKVIFISLAATELLPSCFYGCCYFLVLIIFINFHLISSVHHFLGPDLYLSLHNHPNSLWHAIFWHACYVF